MRVAGYIRVSSKKQKDEGESLPAQEERIKAYAKAQEWELTRIYADKGISGKFMKKREDLKQLMRDAEGKKFDIVIIRTIARFGRNQRQTINNALKLIEDLGIKLISYHENIDFSTPMGKAILGVLAAFAQMENEQRAEAAMESKLKLAREGKLSIGKMPFARIWDKGKCQWELDEAKANLLRQAAKEYLEGGSLSKIDDELDGLKYGQLIATLRERCGDKWEVVLGGETFTYDVPRILDDETIKAIREKSEHNRTYNKALKNEENRNYVLGSFIKCMECERTLTGQTQKGNHSYYRHPRPKSEKETACKAINYINTGVIEKAVMEIIFKNTKDEVGFKKAIKDVFLNRDEIGQLKQHVADRDRELRSIDRRLEELVNMVLKGQIRKETVKSKEDKLYDRKEKLEQENERDQAKIDRSPSIEFIERRAKMIRKEYQQYYQSEERMKEMSYPEKRNLFRWLLPDGLDENGKPYGVFIKRLANGVYNFGVNAVLFAGGHLIKDGKELDIYKTFQANVQFLNSIIPKSIVPSARKNSSLKKST